MLTNRYHLDKSLLNEILPSKTDMKQSIEIWERLIQRKSLPGIHQGIFNHLDFCSGHLALEFIGDLVCRLLAWLPHCFPIASSSLHYFGSELVILCHSKENYHSSIKSDRDSVASQSLPFQFFEMFNSILHLLCGIDMIWPTVLFQTLFIFNPLAFQHRLYLAASIFLSFLFHSLLCSTLYWSMESFRPSAILNSSLQFTQNFSATR